MSAAAATRCASETNGPIPAELRLQDDLPLGGPAEDEPEVPGYELLGRLGSGAMGDVHRARPVGGGPVVALKILAGQGEDLVRGAARFAREVAALAAVDHPNVVRLVEHGCHRGRTWLAMELVEGRDLEAILAERGTLAEADVLRIAIQVARGLGHVHAAAGTIHRDVKPANLLLVPRAAADGGDAVKIIDFGLAKAETDAAMTREGLVVGTPMYMAPEQIRGQRAIGPAADIYALGGTLLHLLTGRPPYEAPNAYEVMRRHLQDPVPDPAARRGGLGAATIRLIATALAKDPAHRQAGWGAFIAEAERALAALSAGGQPLRLLRVELAPGTALRLRRERVGDALDDPFVQELSSRMRRRERAGIVERLEFCPRGEPGGASRSGPSAWTPRKTPSPAALALLRAYRTKMLALPEPPPRPSAVLTATTDDHLVPIALLIASVAAFAALLIT
jgi:serine/threonine protein kinase